MYNEDQNENLMLAVAITTVSIMVATSIGYFMGYNEGACFFAAFMPFGMAPFCIALAQHFDVAGNNATYEVE